MFEKRVITAVNHYIKTAHSLSNVRNIKIALMRSEMGPKSLERETPEKFGVFRIFNENCVKFCIVNRYDPQRDKKSGIEKNQALESFSRRRSRGLLPPSVRMGFLLLQRK